MTTPTPKPEDTPLSIAVENDCIVIRIGIATHAFCALAKNGGPLAENERISDPLQFAKDMCSELSHEDELGATPLTNRLDACIVRAAEQGSTGVRTLKRKAREL